MQAYGYGQSSFGGVLNKIGSHLFFAGNDHGEWRDAAASGRNDRQD